MAEDTTATSPDAAQQADGAQEPTDTTDWKAEARKWEARAKENRQAATELAEIKKAQEDAQQQNQKTLTEAEKAKKRAEKAEKELADLKAAQAREEAVKSVAQKEGVDAELLSMMTGSSVEEIEANAAVLKAKFDAIPKYPEVKDAGNTGAGQAQISKAEILKIKNPREQLRAAIANPQAFT